MASSETTLSGAKLALSIRQLRSQTSDADLLASEPIAIVGIGCRFPGGVQSADDYWSLLHEGRNAVTEVPAHRWNIEEYYHPEVQTPAKMNGRWGGFLENVDRFDPVFFGIAPREAANMDPQQRLLLEVAWEAFWDSGYAPEQLSGSSTGLFVAIYNSDYSRLLLGNESSIGSHTCAGVSNSMASGRISYLLDLHGPSISVDTACSSSLVSVHMAVQSLRARECSMAVAGGVSLKLTPEHYLCLSKLSMLSPDGLCHTFDAAANGFVPGEGCGLVVLKRLSDALIAGDRIRAVIRGTALFQDGRTNVLTAPNGLAQQEVVRSALANAKVKPEDIGYIETHGTGTALGDPIEVEALAEVLGRGDATNPCALGAVKTNIGHLEAASGIAGLIKATLVLEREEIPANLHYCSLNPHMSFEGSRFFVPTKATPWPRTNRGRFAGVSSFGFSGTNAHLVLEEAPALPVKRLEDSGKPQLLALSARTSEALQNVAKQFQDLLANGASQANFTEICAAAAFQRSHYEEKLALVASSAGELKDALSQFLNGQLPTNAAQARSSHDSSAIVFVFSGQGSQWQGMGAELLESEPTFRAALEHCDVEIQKIAGWSVIAELKAPADQSRLNQTEYVQPALFAVQVALAALWKTWGITASAVVGHSAGEIAAAHIAGVLDLEEAVRVIVHRGRIMQAATGLGCMAAVALPVVDVHQAIAGDSKELSIAATNGPSSTVISGDRAAVQSLVRDWSQRGIQAKVLPVDYAFHSAQMAPFEKQLEQILGALRTQPEVIPTFSTIEGRQVRSQDFSAAYWARGIRQSVQFQAAIDLALGAGFGQFLEVGPHPVLLTAVQECAQARNKPVSLLWSLRRNLPERTSLLASLGRLYALGHVVDWKGLFGKTNPFLRLPSYPYERSRFWAEHPSSKPKQLKDNHGFALQSIDSPALTGKVWQTKLDLNEQPFLADHSVQGTAIFPLAGYIELALAAARADNRVMPLAVIGIEVREPLMLHRESPTLVQVILNGDQVKVFARGDESWTEYAQAQFSNQINPVNVSSGEPVTELIPTTDFYKALEERGLEYGPAFQCVQELTAGGSRAHALVGLSGIEPEGWIFHPGLLDGCLQTILAAVNPGEGALYLPLGLDSFALYKPAGAKILCNLEVIRAAADNSTVSANFRITDLSGELVAEGSGFHVRRRASSKKPAAERLAYRIEWQPARSSSTRSAPRAWAIVAKQTSLADPLRAELLKKGTSCPIFESLSEAQPSDSILYFAANENSGPDLPPARQESCRDLLITLQQLVAQPLVSAKEIWIVTNGALHILPSDRCEGYAQATLWGLGRTFALEQPDFKCIRVDVDNSPASLEALVEAMLSEPQEDELGFRLGSVYSPRLSPVPSSAETISIAKKLIVSTRGSLDNLQFEVIERKAPAISEVEVRVEASALNFRDVLNALGAYPGDPGPLGLEFCGKVIRVGTGVTQWAAGDHVAGIAWGVFADYVNVDAALITRVPEGTSSENAVTLPNAFATAYHCLFEVGKLRQRERVLIHAGTGGVGFMAVQLALDAGAEVFATAGSEEKRSFLRAHGVQHVLDSRSLDFSQQILEITNGIGVDVVLNSLAGEFISATMAAVASHGRFVEIGKTGIWNEDQVTALAKNIAYSIVDLGILIDSDHPRIASYLHRMQLMLGEGKIHPLPKHVFAFSEAEAAFRLMARAGHIGKVVLRHGQDFHTHGSWVLSGGLGSIGMRVAEWLAAHGAEHLVLLGRSEPKPEAAEAIHQMRHKGVTVTVASLDVRSIKAMEALTGELNSSPSLVGVVHLAGVLDDGVLTQQTWERYQTVFQPKLDGAELLHKLAITKGAQHFLLFSSVAGLLGSPGQSGYAAANAFLDSFAAHARAHGLNACSIDWGVWGEAGMAARVEAAGKRRTLAALQPMTTSDCLDTLPYTLSGQHHQVAVVAADWKRWQEQYGSAQKSLLSRWHGQPIKSESVVSGTISKSFVHFLTTLPSGRRRAAVLSHLREEAARVLGLSSSYHIDEQHPLMKLGIDSLMALELRNKLSKSFEKPFSATLLFDCPTLSALTDFLLGSEQKPEALLEQRDSVLDLLAELSDEEAERLLEKELGVSSGG
jgi:acyl transferase domain-containing protein/NAD(P)-dependent dehydrogenase (short-subunit alcohol dehydrogenase family)/acyl carrier protein